LSVLTSHWAFGIINFPQIKGIRGYMKYAKRFFLIGLIAFLWVGGAWLGIVVQDLTPRIALRYGLLIQEGVLVTRVQFDSPAKKGGLEEGDVIIALDLKRIPDSKTLQKVISELSPGKSIDLLVIRERKKKTLRILLGAALRDSA